MTSKQKAILNNIKSLQQQLNTEVKSLNNKGYDVKSVYNERTNKDILTINKIGGITEWKYY